MKPVQLARAPWSDAVFICRKCARKAGAASFRKDFKHALKASGTPRRVRVVETSCLDLCPKKRIVVAYASYLARQRLLVVSPDGAPEAVAAIFGNNENIQRGAEGTPALSGHLANPIAQP